MEPKRVGTLVELGDAELFEELSIGMNGLYEHASNLNGAAKTLFAANEGHGGEVLQALAEEEAAKFLMLLDAARCPKQVLGAHLRKFYDHLAHLLYAEAVDLTGIQYFGELREYLERERTSYHLDGAVALEFVMRNQQLWARDETLYVDYVGKDKGQRYWTNPLRWEHDRALSALWLADAMVGVGLASKGSLTVASTIWRDVTVDDGMRWTDRDKLNREVLETMQGKSLLRNQSEDFYYRVIERWQFPMYSIDLREDTVDYNAIKRQSEASWQDDY